MSAYAESGVTMYLGDLLLHVYSEDRLCRDLANAEMQRLHSYKDHISGFWFLV